VSGEAPARADGAVGLCADCAHAQRVVSGRGSLFWLCRLSANDPAFARYPRLPVLRCPGHERKPETR
jgi:hypothetical protein